MPASYWFLDGINPSLCVDCEMSDCWDGEMLGYSSCRKCYAGGAQDCGVCLLAQYRKLSTKDGRAPYFAVRGSFVVTGKLIDSVSKKAAVRKRVMLGFPNGICFHGESNQEGRFTIRVDSTEPGKPGRIDLGTLRHNKKMKFFFIGFALRRAQRSAMKKK